MCERPEALGDLEPREGQGALLGGGLARSWPVGPDGFRVWDAHGHMGLWNKVGYVAADAASNVRRMDEARVERMTFSDIRAIENDPDGGNARMVDACAEFPGRLYGYAGYAPAKYAGRRAAFEDVLDQPGVVGIKLHCQLHGVEPNDPLYRPAYEMAHERGLPLKSHGVPQPAHLREMLQELPGMNYIAAHFGAGPPEGIKAYIEIANEFPNFLLDATGSVISRGAFARLMSQVPATQVVAGSDFPIMDLGQQFGRVIHADIADDIKRQVLWENPCRIYGVGGG